MIYQVLRMSCPLFHRSLSEPARPKEWNATAKIKYEQSERKKRANCAAGWNTILGVRACVASHQRSIGRANKGRSMKSGFASSRTLSTWLCNALSSSSCFFLVLFSGRKRKKLTNMKKTRRISSPQALMTVFSKNLGQFPTKPINFPIPSLKHSRLGLSFLTKSWPRLHPQ